MSARLSFVLGRSSEPQTLLPAGRAQCARRTPKALTAYRAAAPKQSIARRAICDYLYPPVILDIVVDPGPAVVGKRVQIWAYDDTKIVCLSLRTLDAAGHQLESVKTTRLRLST